MSDFSELVATDSSNMYNETDFFSIDAVNWHTGGISSSKFTNIIGLVNHNGTAITRNSSVPPGRRKETQNSKFSSKFKNNMEAEIKE